jgi:hypothetical protein
MRRKKPTFRKCGMSKVSKKVRRGAMCVLGERTIPERRNSKFKDTVVFLYLVILMNNMGLKTLGTK